MSAIPPLSHIKFLFLATCFSGQVNLFLKNVFLFPFLLEFIYLHFFKTGFALYAHPLLLKNAILLPFFYAPTLKQACLPFHHSRILFILIPLIVLEVSKTVVFYMLITHKQINFVYLCFRIPITALLFQQMDGAYKTAILFMFNTHKIRLLPI